MGSVHPDGTTIAQCTTAGSPTVLTCTFTAGVSGYEYVSGQVWVQAQAVQTTEAETVDFGTVTGTVPVDLPGEGGIVPEQPSYPTAIEKQGWLQGGDRDSLHWVIYIPGSEVDNTNGPVTMTDTLSAGQTIRGDIRVEVQTAPGDNWAAVTDGVTITVNDDGSGFEGVFATGTLQPGELYRIAYDTSTINTNIGQTYSNEASIQGNPVSWQVTRTQEGGGTADGPGFGGFAVLKQPVAGDAAALVPADTSFTMRALYSIGGVATTKDLTVTAGGDSAELHGLPVGTVVTLTELAPADVAGVQWGDPVFANPSDSPGVEIAADGESATITIGDQTMAYLEVTNTANPVPSVSVGDYVWFDEDKDGVQDDDESGIPGVELTLTGPDGGPVTDVHGNPVGPVTTGEQGEYVFENLPVLPAGESYTVTVTPPAGYQPTTPGVGDRATDSSTGSAQSTDLTTDGASDMTLDFGFIKQPGPGPTPPPTPGEPTPPVTPPGGPAPPVSPVGPGQPPVPAPAGAAPLAQTGVDAGSLGALAALLVAAGSMAMIGGRRRKA